MTTDTETITWGDLAQSLIDNPGYITLYEKITDDLAKEILATALSDDEYRRELYHTYHGMRTFATRLVNMIQAKNEVIQRLDRDNLQNEDEI